MPATSWFFPVDHGFVLLPDLVLWFGAGLLFGSFANACIHRWPREVSVMRGRSHCPHCDSAIAWRDNIPLLSWALLLGRCRSCRGSISVRYPFVEAATGFGFVACAFAFPGLLMPAAAAALLWALTVAFWVDIDHRIIPDEITITWLLAGLAVSWWVTLGVRDPVGVLAGSFVFGDAANAAGGPASLTRAFLGAATGGGVLGLLRWVGERVYKQEAMGLGDVKLLAAVGAWIGATGALQALFAASVLGAAVSIVLLAGRRVALRSAIPFGPFLVLGTILVAGWNRWAILG